MPTDGLDQRSPDLIGDPDPEPFLLKPKRLSVSFLAPAVTANVLRMTHRATWDDAWARTFHPGRRVQLYASLSKYGADGLIRPIRESEKLDELLITDRYRCQTGSLPHSDYTDGGFQYVHRAAVDALAGRWSPVAHMNPEVLRHLLRLTSYDTWNEIRTQNHWTWVVRFRPLTEDERNRLRFLP